ncbi:dimethyladenosine transferase 2, mitochondrial [Morone saxatilis]|uniref:dimethyladenosine transferase 2, mitochondrial n=1 Tax=Morone saxatilis TaxID=34816 RepID=UPI0015E1CA66|nr:dimethyladenosine transferase 2, mitochondrial [Morone saxatilis]XP_035538315.1 dimethyladenosine transferase 2, mitochondrial [Morone saxatilis]
MSTQILRVVELIMRSACCQTIRSRTCVRKAVLAPVASSGLCVPGAPVLHRRAYSLDSLSSGPGRPTHGPSSQQPCGERSPPRPSALTHRNLSNVAIQCNPPSWNDISDPTPQFQDDVSLPHWEKKRLSVVSQHLADVITQHLQPEDSKSVIFECNPGLGVLTKTLLKAGAKRVVALERHKGYLHNLEELERCSNGRLEVLHCEYFKLDPIGDGIVKRPVMYSEELFTDLGIPETRWTDDIPVKVVGILPPYKERSMLLKMVYALFQQLSVYRYGRIELNFFLREKEYQRLTCRPGDMINYRPFCVLWQIACDIELLHKEPIESFLTGQHTPKHRSKSASNHMCLVRLRPRADLFSAGLSPFNALTLIMMVKQCLAKRKSKLIDMLNVWSPESGSLLLSELGLQEDIWTGSVYPEQYRDLFKLIDSSSEFLHSWLYEEILENTERGGWA